MGAGIIKKLIPTFSFLIIAGIVIIGTLYVIELSNASEENKILARRVTAVIGFIWVVISIIITVF